MAASLPSTAEWPDSARRMCSAWGTKNAGQLLMDEPGKVGVIESGAQADLIVIDGDPLADLTLLARPEQALKAVICDGAFVIDRLPA